MCKKILKRVEIKGSPVQIAHVYIFFKESWDKGKPVQKANVCVSLKAMLKLHCNPQRQSQLLFHNEIEMTKKEINHSCHVEVFNIRIDYK